MKQTKKNFNNFLSHFQESYDRNEISNLNVLFGCISEVITISFIVKVNKGNDRLYYIPKYEYLKSHDIIELEEGIFKVTLYVRMRDQKVKAKKDWSYRIINGIKIYQYKGLV